MIPQPELVVPTDPLRPCRLRVRRVSGFNLEATSRALNGLPVRFVGRPTRWGNPFRIGHEASDAAEAVGLFLDWLDRLPPHYRERLLTPLVGHNLACWCALDRPCHADILLGLACRLAADRQTYVS
ncbi:MAG: DUF4326 domain-containing protein [Alphaproteobacteria bacterium]|nr:DUF4326 domain-containing protein [Alphaproteobacteria bacterium]